MEAAKPVFLLAAIRASWPGEELTRNSHLGLAWSTAALNPAPTIANSNTASGLRGCLCDGGRRSRSTGKERDTETGLDYFGARYFSGAQGRFTSPDPLLSSAHITQPQSWNRYSYALNNPLKFTDPHGLYICNGTKDECKAFESALKQVERARNSFKKGSAEYNALNSSLQAYGKKGVDYGVTIQFGATRSGGAGDTSIGIAVTAGTANKAVTADNPTGQNTIVTLDLAKHTSNGSMDTGLLAVSAAHEGIHVGHGAALVGALPTDLTSAAAASVLAGPLNLTKYGTEFQAYGASSFTSQGLGFGSLRVGGNFEIWNSGWKAADVNTLRSNGINAVLADPNGLYKVTPGAPGKKLIE
jgi:RHS repeat-associated protein